MHDMFFFTDVHGCYELYRAIMTYCTQQDPECSIIFGGDACDRGAYGYKIMKELLDNPKVLYLKGNHEDMFCKAAREIKQHFDFTDSDYDRVKTVLNSCWLFDYKFPAIKDSLANGGLVTLADWIMDGMPMDIVTKLDCLPLTFSIDTCDFCHAGGMYPVFSRVNQAEYDGKAPNEEDAINIVWNRSALNIGWAPNRTCIFGHTPIPYLAEELDMVKGVDPVTPLLYNTDTIPKFTGKKLDMDTGMVFTNRAFVLNVLTMKAQGFERKNNGVEIIEVIQF